MSTRKPSVTIAPAALKTPRRESIMGSRRESVMTNPMNRRQSIMRRNTLFGGKRRQSKPPPLTEEERQALARDRFRRAVFKVKAMLRFGLPLRAPAKPEDKKDKAQINYEPTYRLEPVAGKSFKPQAAERHILDVINDNLRNYKYNKVSAPNFARALSTMIVDKMKEMELPRYKYIANVVIGENKGQTFDFVSRSVWNSTTDNMATASFKATTFFATATVHAVYLD